METADKSQLWKRNLWPIFPLLDWCDWVVVHHLCAYTCAFVDPRQNMCSKAWWASGTSSSRFLLLKCETLDGRTNSQIIPFQLFLSLAALWLFCRFLALFMHGRWNCLWIFLKVIWEDMKLNLMFTHCVVSRLMFNLVAGCEVSFCMMIKYKSLHQICAKMLIGTANIISCIIFLRLFLKFTDNNTTGSINQRKEQHMAIVHFELF